MDLKLPNGATYSVSYKLEDGYPSDVAEYMFKDGNYSCDCNRSVLIDEQYPDLDIEEYDCGDEIEMTNFRIELMVEWFEPFLFG